MVQLRKKCCFFHLINESYNLLMVLGYDTEVTLAGGKSADHHQIQVLHLYYVVGKKHIVETCN